LVTSDHCLRCLSEIYMICEGQYIETNRSNTCFGKGCHRRRQCLIKTLEWIHDNLDDTDPLYDADYHVFYDIEDRLFHVAEFVHNESISICYSNEIGEYPSWAEAMSAYMLFILSKENE